MPTVKIPDYTREQWLAMVRRTVRLSKPEDADPIADLCVEQNKGTWHAAATYYGNIKLCPCAACLKDRAEIARKK